MNQNINTDSKNSKEPQQKYRLGTVSIKILGGFKTALTITRQAEGEEDNSFLADSYKAITPRDGIKYKKTQAESQVDSSFLADRNQAITPKAAFSIRYKRKSKRTILS